MTGANSPLEQEVGNKEEVYLLLCFLVQFSLQHQGLLVRRVIQQNDDPTLLRRLLVVLLNVHQVKTAKELLADATKQALHFSKKAS